MNKQVIKKTPKVNFFRRLGLRALLWILEDESESRTHHINPVLYERVSDGYIYSNFAHPQVEVANLPMDLEKIPFFLTILMIA